MGTVETVGRSVRVSPRLKGSKAASTVSLTNLGILDQLRRKGSSSTDRDVRRGKLKWYSRKAPREAEVQVRGSSSLLEEQISIVSQG